MIIMNLVVLLCCVCSIAAYESTEQLSQAQKGRGYYDTPPGQQYGTGGGNARDQQSTQPQPGWGYYGGPQGAPYKPYGEGRSTEELNRDQGYTPFQYGQGEQQYRPKRASDWTAGPGQPPKQQLQYVYNLQTSTGIPGSSKQHSGFRMLAKITWANLNADVCLMKMTEIKVGEIKNKPLTDPTKISYDFGSVIELVNAEGRQQDKLQLPIKFTCNRGNINNLVFDAEDEPWSMNIKRGVLNLFRVNMHEKPSGSGTDGQFETLTHADRMKKGGNDFYRSMEENVEGDCETDYSIVKLFPVQGGRHDIYNVTKSINLKACRKRPHIKYNFRFGETCESSCDSKQGHEKEEQLLKPTSNAIYTLIGSRNRFVITNAEFKSQYVFSVFNEKSDNIVTYVNQKIDMLRSNTGQVRMEEPKNPVRSKSGNVYSMEWDVAHEKLRMHDQHEPLRRLSATHDFMARHDQAKFLLTNVVQKLKENSKTSNHQDYSENTLKEEPLQLLMKLITLLRTCTKHDLDQISSFISLPQHVRSGGQGQGDDASLMLSMYPSVLGICGTKACVKHLVDQIRQSRFSAVSAALAIQELAKVQVPSSEIVGELMKLASEEGRHQPYFLKQTIWLSLGSVMNALCNNRKDHWATESYHGQKPCPMQLKEKFVQVATEKLQSSPKWEDALIYMKSLSNAGLGPSVPLLEKIITSKDQRVSPMLKSAAVYALKKAPKTKSNNPQKILIPVVTNAREPTGLRISAANILLQTDPDRATLDQLTNLIHDKNVELASFVYTGMNALAKSSNPCEKQTAQDAHQALQNVRRSKRGRLHLSKLKRLSLHDPWQNAGLDFEWVASFSNTTNHAPQHMAFNVHSHFFGHWQKNLISLGLVSDGMDKILGRAYKTFAHGKVKQPRGSSLDDIWSHGLGSRRPNEENDLQDMFSSMTDEYSGQESNGRRDSKGLIYAKFKDQNVAFLPISQEIIQSTLTQLAPKLRQLESYLQNGVPVDLAKALILEQKLYKIPTSAGVPLSVQMNMPAIVRLNGKLQAARSGPKGVKAQADMEYSLETNYMIDHEIWTPIINHGLRLDHKFKQYQPISASVNMDFGKENKMAHVRIRQPTQKLNLVTVETAPVTYTNIWLKFVKNLDHSVEKPVPGEELSKTKYRVNKCFEEVLTGGKMCVKGEMHNIMIDTTGNTPAVPLSGRNKLVLSIEPSPDSREDAIINLSAKLFKSGGGRGLGDRRSELPGGEYQRDYSPSQKSYRNQEEWGDEHSQPSGNALTSQIRVEGESPSRRFAFDVFHMYDMPKGRSKFQMKFMKESERSRGPFMVCVNADVMCHKCSAQQGEDRNGKCLAFNVLLNWGQSCNSNNFITARLKSVGGTSEPSGGDSELYEPTCGDEKRCPLSSKRRQPSSQYSQASKGQNQFRLDVAYNNVPVSVKNSTNKMYRLLKHHYFPQTDVAQIHVRNPDKRITALISINPKNEDQCDITVKMPAENSTFMNVPTPFELFCATDYSDKEFGKPRNKPERGFGKNEIEEEEHEEEEEGMEEEEEPQERGGSHGKPWFERGGDGGEKNEDFFGGQGQTPYGRPGRAGTRFPSRKSEPGRGRPESGYENEDHQENEGEGFFGKKFGSWKNIFSSKQNKYGGEKKKPHDPRFGKGYETEEEYEEYPENEQKSLFGRNLDNLFSSKQNKYGGDKKPYDSKFGKGYETEEDNEEYPQDRDFTRYGKQGGERPDEGYESEKGMFGERSDPFAKSGRYGQKTAEDYDEGSYDEYDQQQRKYPADRYYTEESTGGSCPNKNQRDPQRYSDSKPIRRGDYFDPSQDESRENSQKKHRGHLSVKKHHYDKEEYDWYDSGKCVNCNCGKKGCPARPGGEYASGGYPEDTNERWGDKYRRPEQEQDQYEDDDDPEDTSPEKWEREYKRQGQDQDQDENDSYPEDTTSEKWGTKYNKPLQGQDQYQNPDDTDYYTQRKLYPSCNVATGEGCGPKRSYGGQPGEDYNEYDRYGKNTREMGTKRKSRWTPLGKNEQQYYENDKEWMNDWEPKDHWSKKQQKKFGEKSGKYDDEDEKPSNAWMSNTDDNDEEDENRPSDDYNRKSNAWTSNWGMNRKWSSSKQQKKNSYESSEYGNADDHQGESWESEFTEDDNDDDDPPDDPQQQVHPEGQNKNQNKQPETATSKQQNYESGARKETGPRGTVCVADDSGVRTLDNVQYRFPMTKCFEILTKDCSPDRQFAVMARKVDDKDNTKEILILTRGHKVLIKPNAENSPTGGQVQNIVLHGKKYMTQEDVDTYKPGEKLIKISQDTDLLRTEIVKVGLAVEFDGVQIKLEFPNEVAKKQCGLCGQSADERSRTGGQQQWPNAQDPNYARDLFVRYVIRDEKCQGTSGGQPTPGKQSVATQTLKYDGDKSGVHHGDFRFDPKSEKSRKGGQEYEYPEEDDESADSGYEQEEPDEYNEDQTGKGGRGELAPVRSHGIFETADTICISIIPLHKCGQDTYPEQEVQKTVGYFCLNRQDPRAAQIKRQVDSKQMIPGLENLGPSTTRMEKFPTKCVRA